MGRGRPRDGTARRAHARHTRRECAAQPGVRLRHVDQGWARARQERSGRHGIAPSRPRRATCGRGAPARPAGPSGDGEGASAPHGTDLRSLHLRRNLFSVRSRRLESTAWWPKKESAGESSFLRTQKGSAGTRPASSGRPACARACRRRAGRRRARSASAGSRPRRSDPPEITSSARERPRRAARSSRSR